MQKLKNSELLLSYIREGRAMTQREKLWLIVSLSIPSILAQISATVMFFIDASMVGHLGAKASAAIGLVETTGWLMGGLGSAANMGFSVQVATYPTGWAVMRRLPATLRSISPSSASAASSSRWKAWRARC